MCTSCGCTGQRPRKSRTVNVLQSLLQDNDRTASHNRRHFDSHALLAINLMSSPGAGKTALLEASIDALRGEFGIAVIVGDLETENDAQRVREKGVPAVQIATGSACHLDAQMVHGVLHDMPLDHVDILFIENVGNLVCPASFDLGQHHNVVLLSVTEGDDKPLKYPVMFRCADLTLITKTDLLPYLDDFDPLRARKALAQIGNAGPVLSLSPRKGTGMDAWLDWIRAACHDRRAAAQALQEIDT